MPRPSPLEFCLGTVALVRAGRPITTAATELGVSAAALHNWVCQDQVDRNERRGMRRCSRRVGRRQRPSQPSGIRRAMRSSHAEGGSSSVTTAGSTTARSPGKPGEYASTC